MRAISRSTTKGFTTSALLALCLVALPALAETNRIVIRVNDRIATLHDYEKARRQLIQDLRRSDLPPELLQQRLADVGVEVMSDLFEEMLLLSRADQIDAGPDSLEIEEAIGRAREQAGVKTDEEFVSALSAAGFTLDSFRTHLTKNLTMNSVMGREIRPRIRLNDEDLRRYYQQHLEDFRLPVRLNVREIVVLDSATTSEEDRASIAQDIRERMEAGESPDEIVSGYVEKGLTTPWVDLGWVTAGDLDPALEEAVFELSAGDLVAVPARGGLHLCQVVEREEASIEPFPQVADRIEQQEVNRRFQSEIGEYLAELERNSYVVIEPPPEAASFRSVVERRREEGLERSERELALATAGLDVTQAGDAPEAPDESPDEVEEPPS